MRLKHFQSLCLALFILAFPGVAQAAEAIGKIEALSGIVEKVGAQENAALTTETEIFLGDVIETGDDGLVRIAFIDDTEITLAENTSLTIDEYVFDPANADNSMAEFGILRGAFHYVSGKIADREKPDVTLNLDFGSIGIRGTKIWRDMKLDDNGVLECRIYLEDGSARISNKYGFVTLEHGEGTRIRGPRIRPTSAKPWGEKVITEIKTTLLMPGETLEDKTKMKSEEEPPATEPKMPEAETKAEEASAPTNEETEAAEDAPKETTVEETPAEEASKEEAQPEAKEQEQSEESSEMPKALDDEAQ